MKKNLVTLLGIALAVAILSTGLFYGLFVSRLRKSSSEVTGPAVLIAVKDLERGAAVTAEDVRVAPWGGEAPLGALTSLEQVNGLSVIDAVRKNEVLTGSRVANAVTGAGAGLGIPSGMRAASTHVVDSAGVVALLKTGHRVDVQLVSLSNAPQSAALKTILQNIEVLRVDASADARQPVVTLLVKPEEADMLGLGDSSARIRLTLRNPLDKGVAPLPRQLLEPLFLKGSPGK
jgi:pilus assembly protein CpaB